LVNVESLLKATNIADTGSTTTNRLLQLIEGVPAVINDAITIIDEAILSGGGGRLKVSGVKFLDDAKKEYNRVKSGTNERAIAAAKVSMLETALAYQLTSILQGGTGGRTISDTDVKKTLDMMTGTYSSKEMKMAKLQEIKKMIVAHQNEAKLYNLLQKPGVNSGLYYTVLKSSSLVNSYNKDNFDTKIRKAAGTRPPSEELEKNVGLIKPTAKIAILANTMKALSGGNYSGEDRTMELLRDDRIYKRRMKPITMQEPGSDEKTNYLIPYEGPVRWRNTVEGLRKQNKSEKEIAGRLRSLKKSLQNDYGHGINLETQEIFEIDYLPDGSVNIKGKTLGPGAALNTGTGAAKLFGRG